MIDFKLFDYDCFSFNNIVIIFLIIGHALKPESSSAISSLIDQFKKFYVTKVKGFDIHKMCVATLLLEGTKEVNIIYY